MENQSDQNSTEGGKGETTPQQPQKKDTKPKDKKPVIKSSLFNVHFRAVLQGITTGASLLPSLKAQHKVMSWHFIVEYCIKKLL